MVRTVKLSKMSLLPLIYLYVVTDLRNKRVPFANSFRTVTLEIHFNSFRKRSANNRYSIPKHVTLETASLKFNEDPFRKFLALVIYLNFKHLHRLILSSHFDRILVAITLINPFSNKICIRSISIINVLPTNIDIFASLNLVTDL